MDILLADDHAILRKGLVQLLSEEFPNAKFTEASTSQKILDCLALQDYDVLILDIFMPGRSGLEILHDVKPLYPRLPILVLSIAPEEQLAVRVLKAGANGYLNKQAAPEELVKAVKKILEGGNYVSIALAERLAVEIGNVTRPLHDTLSNREYSVLCRLAMGHSIKEIGEELSLSPKTVSTYRARILQKLRLSNDAALVRYALENGIDGKV